MISPPYRTSQLVDRCDQKPAKLQACTFPIMLPVLAPGHNSLKLTTFGDCDGFCRLASSPWKGLSCRWLKPISKSNAGADIS